MKNRKTVVVAFLLVAVMLLGVGYAALSDTLTITGTAQIDMGAAGNEFDAKVYFNAAKVVDTECTRVNNTTPDTASHTTDDATYEVHSLAVVGDKATFAFEIKSESNVDVKVTAEATKLSGVANPSNSNTDYFIVDYKYYEDAALANEITGDVIIASDSSVWVKVIVTVKAPVTVATGATFGIELTATTVS